MTVIYSVGNARWSGQESFFIYQGAIVRMLNPYKLQRAFAKSNIYLRHPAQVARWAIDLFFGKMFGRILSKDRKGNIATFHMGRCGSTVLGSLLHQHPKIFWDGEIITRFYRFKRKKRYQSFSLEDIQNNQKKIILSRMNIAGAKYYGFETRFFQMKELGMTPAEYINMLESFGFSHFIILERKNYLRVAVSWLIAHDNRKYHQPVIQKAKLRAIKIDINNVKIDSECKPLISYLEEWGYFYREVERFLALKKTLKIIYEEDIIDNPEKGYKRVCDFLRLEPRQVVTQHGRTNPFKMHDLLLNYKEVEKALAGTPFEWMLE